MPDDLTEDITPTEMHAVWIDAVAKEYPAEHAAWVAQIRAQVLTEVADKVKPRFEHGWLSTSECEKVSSWLREQVSHGAG